MKIKKYFLCLLAVVLLMALFGCKQASTISFTDTTIYGYVTNVSGDTLTLALCVDTTGIMGGGGAFQEMPDLEDMRDISGSDMGQMEEPPENSEQTFAIEEPMTNADGTLGQMSDIADKPDADPNFDPTQTGTNPMELPDSESGKMEPMDNPTPDDAGGTSFLVKTTYTFTVASKEVNLSGVTEGAIVEITFDSSSKITSAVISDQQIIDIQNLEFDQPMTEEGEIQLN